MASGALFQLLNGIGREIACDNIENNMHKGRPCIEMHSNLKRGVAGEEFSHLFDLSLRDILSVIRRMAWQSHNGWLAKIASRTTFFNNLRLDPCLHIEKQLVRHIH